MARAWPIISVSAGYTPSPLLHLSYTKGNSDPFPSLSSLPVLARPVAHPGLGSFSLWALAILFPSPGPHVQRCTDPGRFPSLVMPPHVCADVPKENARY